MSVYFIQSGAAGAIKIGWAGKPFKRMATLQVGNAELLRMLLVLPGDQPEEARLHSKFSDIRVRGEWFHPDPILFSFIDGARAACPDQPTAESEGPDFLNGLDDDLLTAIAGWIDCRTAMNSSFGLTVRRVNPLSAHELRRLRKARSLLTSIIYRDDSDPYKAGAKLFAPKEIIDSTQQTLTSMLNRAGSRYLTDDDREELEDEEIDNNEFFPAGYQEFEH